MVLDIEIEGVRQVRRRPDIAARYVFVAPPSDAELERRLRGRGTESDAAVRQRLARARDELAFARENPAAFDRVVVNDDLAKAVDELDRWVYGSEPEPEPEPEPAPEPAPAPAPAS